MTEYYIKPGGAGAKNGTLGNEWEFFSSAMGTLVAGDTLWIDDGTYKNSTGQDMMVVTVEGNSGNPITFKAINDGAVTIDGEGGRIPFDLIGTEGNPKSYLTFEGFVVRNSNNSTIRIRYSDNLTFKRVSSYKASIIAPANYIAWDLWNVNDSLIEDCVGGEEGRKQNNLFDCNNVTVRRFYGSWKDQDIVENAETVGQNSYGSSNCTFENCIHVEDPTATKVVRHGFQIIDNTPIGADNNLFIGCITRDARENLQVSTQGSTDMTGNVFKHCVAFDAIKFGWHAASSGNAENLTLVSRTSAHAERAAIKVNAQALSPVTSDWLTASVKNVSMLSTVGGRGLHFNQSTEILSFSSDYNNLHGFDSPYYDNAVPGANDKTIDPTTVGGYNTSTYGDGAYLMVPDVLKGQGEGGADIGAEVLYKYTDGVLDTSGSVESRLWPWPMEDRIFSETGVSPTWEANGGFWKTLDGVYPETGPSSVTIKGTSKVKDVYVRAGVNANTTYDSVNQIQIKHSATDNLRRYGLISFDFSELSDGVTITSATLRMYYSGYSIGDNPVGQTLQVRRVTQGGWVESEMTWNRYKAGSNWVTGGGDTTGTDLVPHIITGSFGQWIEFNVTEIVKTAQAIDEIAMFQLRFKDISTDNVAIIFIPSEHTTDPSLVPELVINFAGGVNDYYTSANDTARFTESASASFSATPSVSDTAKFTDPVGASFEDPASASDTAKFTDPVGASFEDSASAIDLFSFEDEGFASLTNNLTDNDLASFREYIYVSILGLGYDVNVLDNLTYSEGVGGGLESHVSVNDGSRIFEHYELQPVEGLSIMVVAHENINLTENINRLLESYINVVDGSILTESIGRSLMSVISVQENVTVTESVEPGVLCFIDSIDTVALAESINHTLGLYVNVRDNSRLSDIITVEPSATVGSRLYVTFTLRGAST